MSDDLGQNDTQQNDNLSHHELEPINEHDKEPLEREILKSYAIKHNAKNVNAYINTLKNNGSAVKIIKEYKKQKFITQRAENAIKEIDILLDAITEIVITTTTVYEKNDYEIYEEFLKKAGEKE